MVALTVLVLLGDFMDVSFKFSLNFKSKYSYLDMNSGYGFDKTRSIIYTSFLSNLFVFNSMVIVQNAFTATL